MPSEDVKKIIGSLLARADVANTGRQWNTLSVLSDEILKLDPANDEALAFRTIAKRGGELGTNSSPIDEQGLGEHDTRILPDPKSPRKPTYPRDAIYYSLAGANFIPTRAEHAYSHLVSAQVRESVTTSVIFHAPLNIPDGQRIWGWRCIVDSTAGHVAVWPVRFPYVVANIDKIAIGPSQVSHLSGLEELAMFGLDEVIDNKLNSYALYAYLRREVSSGTYSPVRVKSAVIICRPPK